MVHWKSDEEMKAAALLAQKVREQKRISGNAEAHRHRLFHLFLRSK
jgi:hypothetical protein